MKYLFAFGVYLLSIMSLNDYIRVEWHQLADVRYDYIFNDEYGYELPVAIFSEKIKAMDGKLIQIEGYAYPIETDDGKEIVVLSKYPSNQCFFCGGAGPESVMDIDPITPFKRGQIKMDDILLVRGRLELNKDNLEHLNYIIREAKIID